MFSSHRITRKLPTFRKKMEWKETEKGKESKSPTTNSILILPFHTLIECTKSRAKKKRQSCGE